MAACHEEALALCHEEAKDWHVEGAKRFGPNAIGATLMVSGNWQRSILGACTLPGEEDGKTLDFVETAAHRLRSNPLTLLGDLNADLLNEGAGGDGKCC